MNKPKESAIKYEPNMIDYLDWIEGKPITELRDWRSKRYYKIMEKRDFLKSPPKLGDFVPTNKKGEVMEKPSVIASFGLFEYQQALDRVIWKGWELVKGMDAEMHPEGRWLTNGDHYSDRIAAYSTRSKSLQFKDGATTYEQLITSGVKLERIEKK